MSLSVKRIVNQPVDSNCFVLYQQAHQQCLVIDPGTADCKQLMQFLNENSLIPEYIMLTHEHFDHVWGVVTLKQRFDCKVICMALCSEKITQKKKNMSVFYDQIGFETVPADLFIEKLGYHLLWNDIKIKFFETPGHTDCSMSIWVENKLFVGDLIVSGHKTVTKLPTGDRATAEKSIQNLIFEFKSMSIEVYPGHGNNLMLNEVNINNSI